MVYQAPQELAELCQKIHQACLNLNKVKPRSRKTTGFFVLTQPCCSRHGQGTNWFPMQVGNRLLHINRKHHLAGGLRRKPAELGLVGIEVNLLFVFRPHLEAGTEGEIGFAAPCTLGVANRLQQDELGATGFRHKPELLPADARQCFSRDFAWQDAAARKKPLARPRSFTTLREQKLEAACAIPRRNDIRRGRVGPLADRASNLVRNEFPRPSKLRNLFSRLRIKWIVLHVSLPFRCKKQKIGPMSEPNQNYGIFHT